MLKLQRWLEHGRCAKKKKKKHYSFALLNLMEPKNFLMNTYAFSGFWIFNNLQIPSKILTIICVSFQNNIENLRLSYGLIFIWELNMLVKPGLMERNKFFKESKFFFRVLNLLHIIFGKNLQIRVKLNFLWITREAHLSQFAIGVPRFSFLERKLRARLFS